MYPIYSYFYFRAYRYSASYVSLEVTFLAFDLPLVCFSLIVEMFFGVEDMCDTFIVC